MDMVINIVGILIELFIPLILFKKLGNRKYSLPVFSLFLTGIFIIQVLNNYFFLTKSLIVMLIALASVFLTSFLYQLKLKTRIFSSIFIFISGALSEMLIGIAFTLVTKVTMEELQKNMALFFICTVSSKFLQLAIIWSIGFKNSEKKSLKNLNISFDLLPLPVASLLILLLLFRCCYEINDNSFQIIVICAAIILILANVFIFSLLEKKAEYVNTKVQLAFTQKHIDDQIRHYNELYKYQNDIKNFRHDIKNWLISLLALLESKKYNEATEYAKEKLDFISTPGNIVNSGNPVIDAIIQSKQSIAKNRNIKIESSVKLSKDIAIDQTELGVLIGNALDNAIEATAKIQDSKEPLVISVTISTIVEQLLIDINNPVVENIDVKHIFTTKRNPQNHGFGLRSIQTIAKKYNGDVFLSCEDQKFNTHIILTNE